MRAKKAYGAVPLLATDFSNFFILLLFLSTGITWLK